MYAHARSSPNALRRGRAFRDVNFGWIEIDWSGPAPLVTVQIRDRRGEVTLEQRLDIGQLRVA